MCYLHRVDSVLLQGITQLLLMSMKPNFRNTRMLSATTSRLQTSTVARTLSGESEVPRGFIDDLFSLHFHFHYSAANKCLVKVATMSSNMQEFEKAAEIFEQVCTFLTIETFLGQTCVWASDTSIETQFPLCGHLLCVDGFLVVLNFTIQ